MGKVYTADKFKKTGGTGLNVLMDDGSTLPLPEGGGTRDFIASGTLASGVVVGLRSDGKVEVITDDLIAESYGSEVNFTGNGSYIVSTFDSNTNRIVIAYADAQNSNFGTAIVGEVTGNTISFGTKVVFGGIAIFSNAIIFDSVNNRIVISYSNGTNGNFGTSVVGEVNAGDNSIVFGTPVVFESAVTLHISSTFDSNTDRIVISYSDSGNSSHGTAIVGEVNPTTNAISFGTAVVFNPSNTTYTSSTFDTLNNKVVIVFNFGSPTWYCTAIVGEVTGGATNSIAFGSAVTVHNSNSSSIVSTFDTNANRVIIAFEDALSTDIGTAIVGEVSGTTISFGTPVVFEAGIFQDFISITFDSNSNKIVIAYADGSQADYGKSIVGEVTVGTKIITFGTELTLNSGTTLYTSIVFDSNINKLVIAYQDVSDSSKGNSIVYSPEEITTNVLDSIGITTEAIADTETGTVTVITGTNDQQSGLTIGTLYYVQYDGVITDAPNQDFDYVVLGRAVSTTEILIETIE